MSHEVGDDWVDALQARIDHDMTKVYSPRVLALRKNPVNAGSLDPADGYAAVTEPCGDTMQVWLRVSGGIISEATFWTDGCCSSIVCGSMVTILARGRTPEQASRIDQLVILDKLGGPPEEERHCALLAANWLRGRLPAYHRIPAGPARRAEPPGPGLLFVEEEVDEPDAGNPVEVPDEQSHQEKSMSCPRSAAGLHLRPSCTLAAGNDCCLEQQPHLDVIEPTARAQTLRVVRT
ncbi:MAG: iron-sulfur cluster assembly scaffold protein [candidate division WOR-3 bacterium]